MYTSSYAESPQRPPTMESSCGIVRIGFECWTSEGRTGRRRLAARECKNLVTHSTQFVGLPG